MSVQYNNPFANNGSQQQQANQLPANQQQGEDNLTWDSTIKWQEPMDFITLNPGTYDFTVTGVEKKMYNGNPTAGKEPCHTIVVTLSIDTDEGRANVFHTFYFKQKAIGFMINFMLCIDAIKRGEDITADKWNETFLIGKTGKVRIKNETYNNKTYNRVAAFLHN